MATAYTPILKLALPVTGELNGTWGAVVNDNITSMVEQAVAGLATINTWTTNSHTLTTANGTTSESRCAMLVIDDDGAGNPSAAATVVCPTATKAYIVQNLCGQTVTVKTAAGTGVAVPNNQAALVFCDGTNVVTGSFNGDVVGPASATDNAIARYDGTTGKIIQNSAVTIADDGATVIDANSTSAGLRITQTGTGNAFVVEDSASPDATSFIVDTNGNVGIGNILTVNGNNTITDFIEYTTPVTAATLKYYYSGTFSNSTGNKTYPDPTTASFFATPGYLNRIEFGGTQTATTNTHSIYGIENIFTKSNGNTQDIHSLLFGGSRTNFNWTDLNTCRLYTGQSDFITYRGINANGRTTTGFTNIASSLTLAPPTGGAQTITATSGIFNDLRIQPFGTSTVSITGSSIFASQFYIFNNAAAGAGTKTVNITNHSFVDLQPYGAAVSGATGTVVATITNLYGLRLGDVTGTGLTVTNKFGIHITGATYTNRFGGATQTFPDITTTASASNAYIDTGASNRLYVSTSSIAYKKDVEEIKPEYADTILNLRPVWYRSKAEADPSDWSYYGLIAEEVAEIEPRLVHYGYKKTDYEEVTVSKEEAIKTDDPEFDVNNPDNTRIVDKIELKLKANAKKTPNGVAYDRLSVLLLSIIKRQDQKITELEKRLDGKADK